MGTYGLYGFRLNGRSLFFISAIAVVALLGGVGITQKTVHADPTDILSITEDTTWHAVDEHTYNQSISIENGAVLRIEAGTQVKLGMNGTGDVAQLMVMDGSLIAEGTPENPVIFDRATEADFYQILLDANYTHPEKASLFQSVHFKNGGWIESGGGETSWLPVQIMKTAIAAPQGAATIEYYFGSSQIDHSTFEGSRFADIMLANLYQYDYGDGVGNLLSVHNSSFEQGRLAVVISNASCRDESHGCDVAADLTNNWWGDPSGPKHPSNPSGLGGEVEGSIPVNPWLTTDPQAGCTEGCHSNVLFLPGILGSRLYEDENNLWVSSLDSHQERMMMNVDGTSKYAVYTKDDTQRGDEIDETGLVDDAYGNNLYQSFINDLRDWKTEGVFADYAFIPYDWRLSPEDVIMNGRVADGKLSYTEQNTDLTQSYLYQQAKALQATSHSGRLTLIGHSNGGLIIKAFIQKLKEVNDPLYSQIDQIIFVGVPQTGTPDSVVSLLYGSKIGVLWLGISAEMTRAIGHFMPGMYHLLPSQKLFSAINPPIEFKGNNIDPSWTDRYGDKINSYEEFKDFLTGKEGRVSPDSEDTRQPEILSESLLNQAEANHSVWDDWAPSPETEVIQIAGWGLYTVSGLEVVDEKLCQFSVSQLVDGRPVCDDNRISTVTLRDKLTLNGDATVLVPSALAMEESERVKRYWVDLRRYNQAVPSGSLISNIDRKHKDILEVDTLRPFIKSLVENSGISFQYIYGDEPAAPLNSEYIKYEIHSPLHVTALDTDGNKAGWDAETSTIVENIKGAQYFEIGEIKTLLVPKDTEHTVKLDAYEPGSFTLNIDELDGEEIVSETKFEAIPVLADSVVDIIPAIGTGPIQMSIDFDGNGTTETDLEVIPGESAEYENPAAPDTIPPEISVIFDQNTKDVVWHATDNQDQNPIVVVTSTQITATDASGNVTIIPFIKYREHSTRLKVQFEKVVYNTEEISVPKTTLVYDWKLKKDVLTDLDTELRLKDKSRLKAEYRKQKNETRIIEKDKEEKTKTVKTKPGFVSVNAETKQGNVIWGY